MSSRIGFVQGRLSPPVDGRIQSFPWASWRVEFETAAQLHLHAIEWTLDQDRLHENPLLTAEGREEIRQLAARHGVSIRSLTGDCFMQAPFWKAQATDRAALQRDFLNVARSCAALGISLIVVPLVDNGRLEDGKQEDILTGFFHDQTAWLRTRGLRVAFEADLAPADVVRFIGRLDGGVFGMNYDIGNSAALGFDPADELAAYGSRVLGVHVKDRMRRGPTVPLGDGAAQFDRAFTALARVDYAGTFILQTARAADDDHAGALRRYRDMVSDWLGHRGS